MDTGRLGLITLNMGSAKMYKGYELSNDNQKGAPQADLDILVVCNQETRSGLNIIKEEYLRNYPNVHSIDVNKGRIKSGKQSVTMTMYGKTGAWTDATIESGAIPVPSKEFNTTWFASLGAAGYESGALAYSKGAVWIQININNGRYLFINMHLPMLNDDEHTLGNPYRIQAFRSRILERLRDKIVGARSVFITGDLNFRIETTTGVSQNQLTHLLSIDPLGGEYRDITPNNYNCSFKPLERSVDREDYIRCRTTQTTNTFPPNNIRCFHDKPLRKSRCDRILISTRESQAQPMGTVQMFFFQDILDHNGLYAIFDITHDNLSAVPVSPEESGFNPPTEFINPVFFEAPPLAPGLHSTVRNTLRGGPPPVTRTRNVPTVTGRHPNNSGTIPPQSFVVRNPMHNAAAAAGTGLRKRSRKNMRRRARATRRR
jgi:hypothetical protein